MIKSAKLQQELLRTLQYFKERINPDSNCPRWNCSEECPTARFTSEFEKKRHIAYSGRTYSCASKAAYLKDDIHVRYRAYNVGCAAIVGAYLAHLISEDLKNNEITIEE